MYRETNYSQTKIIKNVHVFSLLILLFPAVIYGQAIQLDWTTSEQDNILHYKIYRSINSNNNFIVLNTVNHPGSTYLDQDVTFDTRYYYIATSVNSQGIESTVSNEAAIFTPKIYTITSYNNPSEGGNIVISPQKSSYVDGEQVTLTASANSGYTFVRWAGAMSSNSATVIITMNSNKSITANFSTNSVSISGNVKYVNSEIALNNTQVNLTGGQTDSHSADDNGYYEFNSLQPGSNYSIAPQRNKYDQGTGIHSYDAALAARIAMNLTPNASEISKIAADANRDGSVQMYDASLIAMYAIGLSPQSDSHVGDWGFYPNNRNYSQLNSEYDEQNFTATILGDVDGNWQPAGPLAKSTDSKKVYSFLKDKKALPGSTVSFPFSTEETIEMLSFDICLKYNYKALKYIGQKKNDLLVTFQIFENKADKGIIKIGGFSPQAVLVNGSFLETLFEVIGAAGSTSQVELISFRINAEPEQYVKKTFIVAGDDFADLPKDYFLYNNYPNPFNPKTNIEYEIPENGNITLKIYNMLGQKVKTLVEEKKKAGAYRAQWDGTNETGQAVPSGIYIYQLLTDNFTATKKMSLMK